MYDIAPPYKNNWQLFLHINQLPVFKGRPFVLTSTVPARVEAFAGEDQALWEVVETPHELTTRVAAKVREVIGRAG